MAATSLKLIVGLGNPGPEHVLTRHNAGFWFVDALARACKRHFREQRKFQGELARVSIAGQEVELLKPLTYMNKSGQSIRSVMDYFRIAPEEVLVAHDELDLPLGTVRLKSGGGAGGHNGLRDTITHIGDAFWRLRIGIGHPGDKDRVLDYVLSRASRQEEDTILPAIGAAVEAMPMLLQEGA